MIAPSLPMEDLKAKLKILIDPIERRPVAYVDIPVHLNIGDLLINAGVEKMFDDYQTLVDQRLTVFDAQRFFGGITRNHVIVLHGGGNFGDIWPRHQQLREAIVARFPQNRILIYPQSVHFSCSNIAREAAKVLRAHKDLHIFVRDRESQTYLAETMGLASTLCPDTAHQLYGTMPRTSDGPVLDRMLFLRRDKEALDVVKSPHVDWDDLVTIQDKAFCGLARIGFKTSYNELHQRTIIGLWYGQRNRAIARSSVYFSQYRTVESSRLHGYILSQLLDIPCTPRDNFYGKISRYISAWRCSHDIQPNQTANHR